MVKYGKTIEGNFEPRSFEENWTWLLQLASSVGQQRMVQSSSEDDRRETLPLLQSTWPDWDGNGVVDELIDQQVIISTTDDTRFDAALVDSPQRAKIDFLVKVMNNYVDRKSVEEWRTVELTATKWSCPTPTHEFHLIMVQRLGIFTGSPAMTYFETSAMLFSFVLLGKYLESLTKGKTSEAIGKLLELAPTTAILLTVDSSILIQRGDLLKVPPVAKVPADGIAVCGASPINKSMITGESSPAANKMGDSVIDGTLNMNGVMHIQAMRVGRNTALAQIINLVEAAQMTKAPTQKFADCVASIFVPVVVSMAVTTFLAAVIVATGIGASSGILIKGGDALERAHKVCLKQAGSEHPLAKAIVDYKHYFLEFGGPSTLKAAPTLRNRDTSWLKSASSFENIPGKGVHCQVDNKGILVGNQKLMSNSGVAILKATEDYLQAQTVVIVAFDGAVADGTVVAMVGDGINDMPARTAADVGMAIGAGTGIVIEAADYVLMHNSVEDVITATDLSQKSN
ncbi:unnamed protein product [Sphagnum tenellum]